MRVVAQAVAAGAQAHAAGREPVLRRSHRRHRGPVRLPLVPRHARRGRLVGRVARRVKAMEAAAGPDAWPTPRSPPSSQSAIWRGGECAPEPAAMPSGFAELDAVLPGRGWPACALTEIAARARRHRRDPAHAACARAPAGGASRRRLDRAAARALRAGARGRGARSRAAPDRPLPEQRRRAVGVRAGAARARMRRRVRVARRARRARAAPARGRRARRPHLGRAVAASRPHAIASAAPLRLALAPHERRLAVRVLKRRGGDSRGRC